MGFKNGYVPASALTVIDDSGARLAIPQARAYKRAIAALRKRYPSARVAGKYGGERSYSVQEAMHAASVSHSAALKAMYNLSTVSTVPLARGGYSTHGLGTSFDLVGAPINDWVLDTLRKYGWTRTFGTRDPNHFGHDGKTATAVTPSAKVYYVVKNHDNLSLIASKYKTTPAKIKSLNPGLITNINNIKVGWRIRVK